MVDIAPFRALRYDPATTGDVVRTSAPAYDTLEPLSYASHRSSNPYTVLELHAPDGAYRRAGAMYRGWRAQGVLVADASPAVFLYEQHELVGGVPRVQRGLLAAVRLDPRDPRDAVLPHEFVDDARVAQRLERLTELPVELTPVHAILERSPPELAARLAAPPTRAPSVALTDEDGVDHRIWAIRDPDEQRQLRGLLSGVRAVILDGHHRWARSLAHRRARSGDGAVGAEPWDRALVFLVDPTFGPRVQAVHRLLRPVGQATWDALAHDFRRLPAPRDPQALSALVAQTPAPSFGLVAPGGATSLLVPHDAENLRSRARAQGRPFGDLDVAILDLVVLPQLGQAPVMEPRADTGEAIALVRAHDDAALVVVRPVALTGLVAVAGAGLRLPAKSTHVVPKVRSGLLLRPLDEPS